MAVNEMKQIMGEQFKVIYPGMVIGWDYARI